MLTFLPGKSSITIRFVYNDFSDEYDPTRADSFRRHLPDGSIIDILDTAGQEQYAAVRGGKRKEYFYLYFTYSD